MCVPREKLHTPLSILQTTQCEISFTFVTCFHDISITGTRPKQKAVKNTWRFACMGGALQKVAISYLQNKSCLCDAQSDRQPAATQRGYASGLQHMCHAQRAPLQVKHQALLVGPEVTQTFLLIPSCCLSPAATGQSADLWRCPRRTRPCWRPLQARAWGRASGEGCACGTFEGPRCCHCTRRCSWYWSWTGSRPTTCCCSAPSPRWPHPGRTCGCRRAGRAAAERCWARCGASTVPSGDAAGPPGRRRLFLRPGRRRPGRSRSRPLPGRPPARLCCSWCLLPRHCHCDLGSGHRHNYWNKWRCWRRWKKHCGGLPWS